MINICSDVVPNRLENICGGMAYDKCKNIIYNNTCEMVPIGYVKMGKIVYYKR